MKRWYIILFSGILAVLLSGCMRSADVPDIAYEDGGAHDASLPVPIEFSLPATKGLVNAPTDLTHQSVFGMFAVADDTDDLREDDGLNMRNKLCSYDEESMTLQFGYSSEGRTVYYPNNGKNYTFYTYHSWTDDENMTISGYDDEGVQTVSEMTSSGRQICVDLSVGTQYDVLYAKAEAPYFEDETGTPMDGFNNAYIRASGNKPEFVFDHPAACVAFRVVLDEASQKKTIGTGQHLRLCSMKFSELATKASLCIVDLDNPANEGKFVKAVTMTSNKMWMLEGAGTGNINVDIVADSDGDGVTEICRDGEPYSLGQFFIMPQDEPLVLTVSMRRQKIDPADGSIDGNWSPWNYTFTLDPEDFGAVESGYKAGMIYRYKLVVTYDSDTVSPDDPETNGVKMKIVADI